MAQTMSIAKGKRLQRGLNRVCKERLLGVTPLKVDGVIGHATRLRIRFVKYYMGYVRKHINGSAGKRFLWYLEHDRGLYPGRNKVNEKKRRKMAIKRRYVQRREFRKERRRLRQWKHKTGFAVWTNPNGQKIVVAAWMVYWLERAKEKGWSGYVNSGVRTAAYSIHLCFVMCGRAFCPGRCAGASSRHNMEKFQGFPFGAVDVQDYFRFGQIMRELGAPLKNVLGAQDPVHYSYAGN